MRRSTAEMERFTEQVELEKRTEGSNGGFESFGDFLVAVRKDATYNRLSYRRDPRLNALEMRAQPAGSGEQIPADGGFLVPVSYSNLILRRMYNVGEIFKRTKQIPITTNSYTFPAFDEQARATGSRYGGIQVYAVNEADSATKSKPRLRRNEIYTNKIIGLLEASDELVSDAEAYAAQMTDAFAEEMIFTLENYIVNGTGVDEPLGIINAPATITVPKVGGQASATVNTQNVTSMIGAFWAKSFNSDGAIWLYNQALLPQLSTLSTIVGTGGSESKIWQWAQYAADDDMLAGFAAIQSEYCAVPGTPGDIFLADFSRYALVVRELLRNEVSMHLLFLSDQAAFRLVMRIGGQPIDHTPVTPKNGTQQTSTFVALAQR